MVIPRFMCQRVMAALGRTYYFCMGFRVVIKGKQVSSSEAPILAVAPHSTFFDGIVCIVAGLPSTVSRVENLATPIFGSETLSILLCCFRKVCVLGGGGGGFLVLTTSSMCESLQKYLHVCHIVNLFNLFIFT